ncbi:hypothetical protein N7478_011102 [Penicillium angulare]|nr:uncharacterized protein N7478_011102 [Penicillium angulare]KAJ5263497.1 hypothetical protein N7478_011102 [Penicillium angulare]
MAAIRAPREKKTTRRRVMGLSDDSVIRVKDAKRSIAERKAKEDKKDERRAVKELEKKYGVPTTPRITEAQREAEAEPLYSESGEVIGFYDKF